MKKILVLLVSLFCSVGVIFASDMNFGQWYDQDGKLVSDREIGKAFSKAFMQGAVDQAETLMPIYEMMKTCSPVQGDVITVFGKTNGKCHFSYASYDCYVPMNVAQNFSSNALKSLQNLKDGNFSTSSSESQYIESILNNTTYCKIK